MNGPADEEGEGDFFLFGGVVVQVELGKPRFHAVDKSPDAAMEEKQNLIPVGEDGLMQAGNEGFRVRCRAARQRKSWT